jgi:penicillin-insensitive murein endopeptidase
LWITAQRAIAVSSSKTVTRHERFTWPAHRRMQVAELQQPKKPRFQPLYSRSFGAVWNHFLGPWNLSGGRAALDGRLSAKSDRKAPRDPTPNRKRRRLKNRTTNRPVVETLSYAQIVDPRRVAPGSLSIGTVSDGRMVRAHRLWLVGQHHRVLKLCWRRRTNFGTDEMISLLLHGAQNVATAFPGSQLAVGNIARKKGGKIRWSRSHRTGRDADVMFYVRFLGKRCTSPGFVKFKNGSMRSVTGRYGFDTERNWHLVKSLITHPTIQVQWLFIAEHLRNALLNWAIDHNENLALVDRAAKVLHQPSDSAPHDDHIHIRIYCSRQDRLEACRNTGPVWRWINSFDRALEVRINTLLAGFEDQDPMMRVRVIRFLQRLHAIQVAPHIAKRGLWDPNAKVRHATLDALVEWGNQDPRVVRALLHIILRPGGGLHRGDPDFGLTLLDELGLRHMTVKNKTKAPLALPTPPFDTVRTPHQIRRAYVALSRLNAPQTIPFLKKAIFSDRIIGRSKRYRQPLHETLLAAWAAREKTDTAMVASLIKQLDHHRPDVRKTVAATLRLITNHSFGVRWRNNMTRKHRHRHIRRWQTWWSAHKDKSRRELLISGFRRVRPRLKRYAKINNPWALRNLIAITHGRGFRGENAHRFLCALTHLDVPYTTPGQRHRWWLHWWYARFAHLVLPKARSGGGPR